MLWHKVPILIGLVPSMGFVDLSVINGEVVVQDGRFKTIDLQVHWA